MGPRKRSKPNPKAESKTASEEAPPNLQNKDSLQAVGGTSVPSDKPNSVEPVHSSVNGANSVSAEDSPLVQNKTDVVQIQPSKTWYGGTWPRGSKANPITQVAKESISAAGGAASEVLASARDHSPELPTTPLKSPALHLSRSVGSSSRPLPLAATTTKLHITSNATNPKSTAKDRGTIKDERDPLRGPEVQQLSKADSEVEKSDDATLGNSSENREIRPESQSLVLDVPKAANESISWLNWFSKSEIAAEIGTSIAQADVDASSAGKDRPQNPISETLQDASTSRKQRRKSEPSPISPTLQQEDAPRSWLSLWGNVSAQTKNNSSASVAGVASDPRNDLSGSGSRSGKADSAEPDSVSNSQPPQQPGDSTKSSYGWAFWSRDQPKSDDEKTCPGSEVGELALAGSSSQTKPESAVVDEARGLPNKVGKRQRPQSLGVAEDPKKSRSTDDDDKKDSKSEVTPLAPETKPKVDASSKAKSLPRNLLLPSFRTTYSSRGRPSLIHKISRLLQLSSPSEPKHVDIVQHPPRLNRALAIVSLSRSSRIPYT